MKSKVRLFFSNGMWQDVVLATYVTHNLSQIRRVCAGVYPGTIWDYEVLKTTTGVMR